MQIQQAAVAATTISYSRVSTWLRCPRRYRFRYVDQAEEERTSAALILGSAIHEAVEVFFNGLKSGNPPVEDEVFAAFDLAFTDSANLAEELGAPVDWGKSSFDEQADKGTEMLRVFLADVDRDIEVIGVEQSFEFELAPGLNVAGVIDLILRDSDRIRVVDVKTSASSYGQDKLLYDLQPTVYMLAAERMFNAPAKVDFEYWVLTKSKQPALKIHPVVRAEADRLELVEAFQEVRAADASGVFPRIRGWQCATCEHRDRCGKGACP